MFKGFTYDNTLKSKNVGGFEHSVMPMCRFLSLIMWCVPMHVTTPRPCHPDPRAGTPRKPGAHDLLHHSHVSGFRGPLPGL